MELNLERLQEAERYLGSVEDAIYNMIKRLKLEERDEIFNTLSMLSEGLEWLLTIFDLTKEVQIEKIEIGEITDIIETLIEGMENKDWTLISDCLEYSLLDQIIEWRRVVRVTLDYYHIPLLSETEENKSI